MQMKRGDKGMKERKESPFEWSAPGLEFHKQGEASNLSFSRLSEAEGSVPRAGTSWVSLFGKLGVPLCQAHSNLASAHSVPETHTLAHTCLWGASWWLPLHSSKSINCSHFPGCRFLFAHKCQVWRRRRCSPCSWLHLYPMWGGILLLKIFCLILTLMFVELVSCWCGFSEASRKIFNSSVVG